ncbi:MAG TPA: VOC family protein, partial [Thermomicrobiales bacterium]|nr:VOC family protein [Thermomicrobiales bacterium]
MKAQLGLVEIVVQDMARSLAFYRRLGLDLPPETDREPHVDTALPGGLRLAWDTVETIHSFDPSWTPASGGPRMSLAFQMESPAGVNRMYAELT